MANEAFTFINATQEYFFFLYVCPLQVLYNYICIIRYCVSVCKFINKHIFVNIWTCDIVKTLL